MTDSECIDLAWFGNPPRPYRIIDPELIDYAVDRVVEKNGKSVIETSRVSFTVCSSKEATSDEIERWRAQT